MCKIGFGGGCHWCTEAVFQSLKGVKKVEQGWISPASDVSDFSEGVLVHFEPKQIGLDVLIAIHVHTHSATANHSMRQKYRSAIYTFSKDQEVASRKAVDEIQKDFEQTLITKILAFGNFNLNHEQFRNYYYNKSDRPFCKNYIQTKLKKILKKFSGHAENEIIRNSFNK